MTKVKNKSRGMVSLFGGAIAVMGALMGYIYLTDRADETPIEPFSASGALSENARAQDLEQLIANTELMARRMQELSLKSDGWQIKAVPVTDADAVIEQGG